MSEAEVLSEAYEHALADVRLIHRDFHAALTAARERPVGRFNAEQLASSTRTNQLAIAAMVAIVEHYVEAVLVDSGSSARAIQNWASKEQAWQDTFGAGLRETCSSFLGMLGFYEARTAVMHAQGTLTEAQRRSPRKDKVNAALKAAGIERHRHQLILTAGVVDRCSLVCCAALREMEDARIAGCIEPVDRPDG